MCLTVLLLGPRSASALAGNSPPRTKTPIKTTFSLSQLDEAASDLSEWCPFVPKAGIVWHGMLCKRCGLKQSQHTKNPTGGAGCSQPVSGLSSPKVFEKTYTRSYPTPAAPISGEPVSSPRAKAKFSSAPRPAPPSYSYLSSAPAAPISGEAASSPRNAPKPTAPRPSTSYYSGAAPYSGEPMPRAGGGVRPGR